MASSLFSRIVRTKTIPPGDLGTPLKRCLSTLDLTLIGVAHMVGAGIYILTGAVLRNTAGPSIVLSFLIAGLAALLCALCYAEFGARYPKAGSAYTYTYVGCGEIWAFVIGWNIVLEQLIGSATMARSWSGYLDHLLGGRISNLTLETLGPMGAEHSLLAHYPDFPAVVICIVGAVIAAVGNKTNVRFITFFSGCNLLVVSFVIVYGSQFIDLGNWQGTIASGASRFFPFGIHGTIAGAATCFFSYIGFESLASGGEEAKDPGRSVPLAALSAVGIATTAYVLMATVLSLMTPFEEVHPATAFPQAFASHGAAFAQYLVAAGAMCGMSGNLLSSSFAMPRMVYGMASDGLIFSWLAKIHAKTQTPVNAGATFTILVCLMALLLDLEALVEFFSIGTLVAYTIVSSSLIIHRYRPDESEVDKGDQRAGHLRLRFPLLSRLDDSLPPARLVIYLLVVMLISDLAFGFIFANSAFDDTIRLILLSFLGSISLISVLLIDCHQQTSMPLPFKVPLVPYLPSVSVMMNILMITHLSWKTWLRFTIWMAIGMLIYLLYGLRHSKEAKLREDAAREFEAKEEAITHVD